MFYRVVPAVNLAMLLFGVGSWSVAAALPLPSQVRLYHGMPSISGGVGEEARALLQPRVHRQPHLRCPRRQRSR
jgi:hypothetical protein